MSEELEPVQYDRFEKRWKGRGYITEIMDCKLELVEQWLLMRLNIEAGYYYPSWERELGDYDVGCAIAWHARKAGKAPSTVSKILNSLESKGEVEVFRSKGNCPIVRLLHPFFTAHNWPIGEHGDECAFTESRGKGGRLA